MSSTPAKILTKARGISVGTLMEFFLLDASSILSIYTGSPGPIYAFHNSNTQGTDPIAFQSVNYQAFPLNTDGFELTMKGQAARPKMTFSNIGAIGSAILREFSDLVGAIVTRKLTLFEYLDAQPGHDATQEMQPMVFAIDNKNAENKQVVTLELTTSMDVAGAMVPGGTVTANACPWQFRSGVGCDYAGQPVMDQYGNLFATTIGTLNARGLYDPAGTYNRGDYAYRLLRGVREYRVCLVNGTHANLTTGAGLITDVTKWTAGVCIKSQSACEAHFGVNASLPARIFPAIVRAPTG